MLKLWDITIYLSIRRLKLKRPSILSVGENVKKQEFTYIDGENIKWYYHFGKRFRHFFKKLNIHLPFYYWSFTQQLKKAYVPKKKNT